MALTRAGFMPSQMQRVLLDACGSATAVYENRHDLAQVLTDATEACHRVLAAMDSVLPRCQQELEFAIRSHIQCICLADAEYPMRLRECDDAPILLFYRGNADLNHARIISMVGTRQCTPYGQDLCRTFLHDLHALVPDVLVVSGLAYGVDINAHRQALHCGYPTVGVLAHGLDQIYPRMHRDTAVQMVGQGGLLTEYMSGTAADKKNFVARNRIVAGIADATIVIESACKGGSLITAEIAEGYDRDVFAFPGRTGDLYSQGCNMLIRQNRAALLTSAQDFVEAMGWHTAADLAAHRHQPVQRQLFVDLTPEQEAVARALHGVDHMSLALLSNATGIPISRLSGILLEMEMQGLVRMLNGGLYRLL